jgi:MFS family permease
MASAQPGLVGQIKSYPSTFWVANTMEIFERMAWYGFYAVSSLYITGPTETGGLGFTSVQRGQIQAIVPFFLYLFPVVTGALADRYGYKRMFTIAYVGMIIFYYLLGQATSMPGFLLMFMFVAVAAAIFKPVVVGTVARVTNETNSSTGFGIFYMMVNVGGFLGPMLAGVVRGISWNYVFIACSCWAAVNLIIVTLFYREPTTEAGSAGARTFRKVMDDAVEVLGNLRFFICVFVILIALMIPGFRWPWFMWTHCVIFVGAWLVLNLIWDVLMPAGSGRPQKMGPSRPFYLKRMYCSNWRFALFLLIMSGFWTSFNQIFLTMPEYIRDYTETRPMVRAGEKVFAALGKPEWIDGLAAIEQVELFQEFDRLVRKSRGAEPMLPAAAPTTESLSEDKDTAIEALKKLRKKRTLSDNDRSRINEAIIQLESGKGAEDQAELDLRSASRADQEEAAREFMEVVGAADPSRAMVDGLLEVTDDLLKLYSAQARVSAAEDLAEEIERRQRIEKLAEDPSVTQADLDQLSVTLERIQAAHGKNRLEIIDVVDAARTFLQYKVRIQPTDLADLIVTVPDRLETVSEQSLDAAMTTLEARLRDRGLEPLSEEQRSRVRMRMKTLLIDQGPVVGKEALIDACSELQSGGLNLEPALLAFGVRDGAYRPFIWDRVSAGRQVNPEHIVNFDAGAIVLLQVLISYLMARFHRFTTMIVGMFVAAVGIGLSAVAGGTMIGPLGGLLIVVIIGIVVFAVGEMMASPTSQEYVGRIAPRDKAALYMGYYFVAISLGNLFGGILSGELYELLAVNMQRPDLMWLAFGAIMLGTAVVFMLYNKFALPKLAAHQLTGA